MKTLKILVVLSFVFFSNVVVADTYPVVVDSTAAFASCNAKIVSINQTSAWWGGTPVCKIYGTNVPQDWVGIWVGTTSYANQGVWTAAVTCPAGGTRSASNCINAISCILPQVRSSTTGLCVAPPVTCTAGDIANISIPIGTYPPAGTPPTVTLTQDRSSTTTVPTTVSVGGCVYNIPLNPSKTGCFSDQNNVMYCNTVATKSGGYASGADTAKIPSVSDTPVPSAKPNCITSAGGVEICNVSQTKNCGTVNGTSVCVKDGALQTNGMPATIINGQVVGTTTNVNGQTERCAGGGYSTGTTCINMPTLACGPGTAFVCFVPEPTTAQPSPNPIPISNDPVTVTKHASVTNPDNTRTVTDTTTQDIVGQSPYKQTQTFDAAGNLIQTTYTGANVGTGNGVSTDPGDGSNNVDIGAPGAAISPGDLSGIDSVFASGTSAMTSAANGISASNLISTPIIPQSSGSACQTVPMNYKSLHYTFDPCGKLAIFREMFGYLLYILTVYSIYEIAVTANGGQYGTKSI
jgi:hypothetical protein